jgi:6-phosphofructokinase 1
LGGDGTHAGVQELFKEIKYSIYDIYILNRRRKLKIAVVGIPKTIDNDIPIIDKSFGFETAV